MINHTCPTHNLYNILQKSLNFLFAIKYIALVVKCKYYKLPRLIRYINETKFKTKTTLIRNIQIDNIPFLQNTLSL